MFSSVLFGALIHTIVICDFKSFAYKHLNLSHSFNNQIPDAFISQRRAIQYRRCLKKNDPCRYSKIFRGTKKYSDILTTMTLQTDDDYNSGGKQEGTKSSKQIVFVRHGCTYMNEYLASPGSEWGDPNFTDIFTVEKQPEVYYRDSPLSDKGLRQAKNLSKELLSSSSPHADIVNEIELIAVSPLRRALQTMELGLLPYILHLQSENKVEWEDKADSDDTLTSTVSSRKSALSVQKSIKVPIVALPHASERLYLISDLGTSTSQISRSYPYVNFESEFNHLNNDEWWFKVTSDGVDDDPTSDIKKDKRTSDQKHSYCNRLSKRHYKEWRPDGQGQTYFCPGEPDAYFEQRMTALYKWLESRDEMTICLVAHWGVLQWLTGHDFDNCELKVVDFDDLQCNK